MVILFCKFDFSYWKNKIMREGSLFSFLASNIREAVGRKSFDRGNLLGTLPLAICPPQEIFNTQALTEIYPDAFFSPLLIRSCPCIIFFFFVKRPKFRAIFHVINLFFPSLSLSLSLLLLLFRLFVQVDALFKITQETASGL